MKELARVKAIHTPQISAAREGSMKALTVVQSKELSAHSLKGDQAIHNPAINAGDFHFAIIAMLEMGQIQRGSSGENYGERVGRESCKPNLVLAQECMEGHLLTNKEECERGLALLSDPAWKVVIVWWVFLADVPTPEEEHRY
nr:hypothetical protein CFP56_66750 [Quercus suber]